MAVCIRQRFVPADIVHLPYRKLQSRNHDSRRRQRNPQGTANESLHNTQPSLSALPAQKPGTGPTVVRAGAADADRPGCRTLALSPRLARVVSVQFNSQLEEPLDITTMSRMYGKSVPCVCLVLGERR